MTADAGTNTTVVGRLPAEGLLAITGDDRATWLQGMISQDVRTLTPGMGRYGCAVDGKGRIVADFQIYAAPARAALLLATPRERVAPLKEHLERFLVTEDVTLADESGTVEILTVQGPEADRLLGHPAQDLGSLQVGESTVRAARRVRGPDPGYDLWVAPGRTQAVLDALRAGGASPGDASDLLRRRVMGAIPAWPDDLDARTIPLEACLDDAIHWEKGCYLGQEVIARMAHRGHTNRELRQVRVAAREAPPRNTPLFPLDGEDRACGRITSAVFVPEIGAVLALAFVRRSHFVAGTRMRLGDAGPEAIVTDRRIRAALVDR